MVAVDSANCARTCRGGWSLVAEGRWSLYARYFTLRTIRPKESGRNRQVVAIYEWSLTQVLLYFFRYLLFLPLPNISSALFLPLYFFCYISSPIFLPLHFYRYISSVIFLLLDLYLCISTAKFLSLCAFRSAV